MQRAECLAILLILLPLVGGTSAAVLTSSWNDGAVENGPQYPSVYTFEKPFRLLSLETYHWNDGYGVERPGSLSIIDENGNEYGPWPASGSEGSGGVLNAIWTAYPDEVFPAGTYEVSDSDPDTWSHNYESGYTGFVKYRYDYVEEKDDPIVPESPVTVSPTVLDYTTTSGVDDSSQPVDRKSVFSTQDKTAEFWAKIGPLYGGEVRDIVFYDPSGKEFYRHTYTIGDPAAEGYDFWKTFETSAMIFIAGKNGEKYPGKWTVKLYLNGEFLVSDTFTIEESGSAGSEPNIIDPIVIPHEPAQVLDYRITSGLENLLPIDKKDTFSPQDGQVYFWTKVGPLYGGEMRDIVFLDPEGKEYYRATSVVEDPADSGKEYWEQYYLSSYIDIFGYEAELHPGT